MTKKQHKLQVKPVKLLCLTPSPEQKQAHNPFEPSSLRLAMRKAAVTLEDWTERFEAWCRVPIAGRILFGEDGRDARQLRCRLLVAHARSQATDAFQQAVAP